MVSARKPYVPERGDVVWINFKPQAGREQAGMRPALVLSPSAYNVKTSLAVLCPITSHVKGYPFEVLIPSGHKAAGAILSDHVKSFDWKARGASFCCKMPNEVVEDVVAKLSALVNT